MTTLKNIKKQLNNIDNNSKLIITSPKINILPSFKLKKINDREYVLYISKKVTDINELFKDNRQIKELVFDNWNTSNLEHIDYTFSGMEVNEFPDFSKQDFTNVISANYLFKNVLLNKNFKFKNHTFTNLEHIKGIFLEAKGKDIEVDLGKTNLRNCIGIFYGTIANKVTLKIEETNKNVFFKKFFLYSKINEINLKDCNMENYADFGITLVDIETNELTMPEKASHMARIMTFLSKDIDEIYMKREWKGKIHII